MTIKLLIADVDGTLVTQSKTLTVRARDAVERLRAAGIAFAITSGRPPRGMAMLSGPLALTTPVAGFDGGVVVKPDLTTVIEQLTLPTDVAKEVVAYLVHSGLDVWVYRGTDWFIRRRDAPHVAREEHNVQFAPTILSELDGVLDDVVKIVGVSDDLPLVERTAAELRRRIGKHASAARSQPYYLDVTHPDANKGMVVRHLSRMLDIPLPEVATIGDMPTDVLMFGIGGLSIAMGNASPEVQRCARHVTTSNEDEGFANAVDWFILDTDAAPSASPGHGRDQAGVAEQHSRVPLRP